MKYVYATLVLASLAAATSVLGGGSSQVATVRAVEEQPRNRFRVVLGPPPQNSFFGAGCGAIIITGDRAGSIRNPAERGATAAQTRQALATLRAALVGHQPIRFGGMIDAFDDRSRTNPCEFLVRGLVEVEEFGGARTVYAYR